MEIKRALISVSDKTNVAEFATRLQKAKVKILSTGGTAKTLRSAGIEVQEVSEYTGFPEMLEGRVKTLHPKIEAGILADREKPDHMSTLKQHGIEPIDLVVVNLYPFKKTIADPNASIKKAIENIDIGGPTLIRAAAKNHRGVAVVVDPQDYEKISEQIEQGVVTKEFLEFLAQKAFAHTASYDAAISRYLGEKFASERFPQDMTLSFEKRYDLRYGENSHQKAAFYAEATDETSIPNARIISEGKKLSFNNILDADSALELVKEFDEPAAVIVKHLNPSGVGVGKDISGAYEMAHKADPLSAFGCVVALNRPPTKELAEKIASTFVELVIAPSFSQETIDIFSKKPNMRILEVGTIRKTSSKTLDMRRVLSGVLIQERDLLLPKYDDLKIVTKTKPTDEQMDAMLFAWKVCRHTKSNSIIFAKKDHTVGVGAGQMSRVDAVKIAAMKAKDHAIGAVMASDAFFPFPDGIEEAAKAGIKAIIQPGGSIRDEQVIEAADKAQIAMVFCGIRCFLH